MGVSERISRWIRRNFDWLSVWKFTFAAVALWDLWSCGELLLDAWDNTQDCSESSCSIIISSPSWIGVFFCVLCVVESIIRAREARRLALENFALDSFERKLRRAYSTTRVSFGLRNTNQHLDEVLAKTTLRTYIPICSVVVFWLVLLPSSMDYRCGNDTAVATVWITKSLQNFIYFCNTFNEWFARFFWKKALPFKFYQPRRYLARIRKLLRMIRYVRFAFPLARMILKLNDQLLALSKMWRQSITVKTERARRLARPSLLFEDLKRVESIAKVQTALAALPSRLSQYASSELSEISDTLQRHQRHGRVLQRRIQSIKRGIGRNLEASGHYDRIVLLTQELNRTVHNTLLSSHHLLSPRTRFSIAWRMTVTSVLMVEILRLIFSWKISGTFEISLSQLISRILVECDQPELTRKRMAFIMKRVDGLRAKLSNAIPIISAPVNPTVCVPSSPSATLFLQLGGMLENSIDIVSFMDIFIWFYTGDLDSNGVIVPKPFFTRCIMPGTLVQVLDHPTLPETLPSLIAHTMDAASAVGWSRAIRWVLAIVPACAMLFKPLKAYFFGHVDATKGIMSYAESCGILAPARPSTSNMHPGFGSSIRSHPSQVGLSLDLGGSFRSQSGQVGLSFDHPSTTIFGGRNVVTPRSYDSIPNRESSGEDRLDASSK